MDQVSEAQWDAIQGLLNKLVGLCSSFFMSCLIHWISFSFATIFKDANNANLNNFPMHSDAKTIYGLGII